jgi:hypothetical protein
MTGLTFIMGANYSGTSMVARVCHDNGAWMGNYTTGYDETLPYDKYESSELAMLCRTGLGFEWHYDPAKLEDLFREFFASLPVETEAVVLKYPKSYAFIPDFRDKYGLKFQIVQVLRDPVDRAAFCCKQIPGFAPQTAIDMWRDAYSSIATTAVGIPLYTVLYERFLVEPLIETRNLLKFIGLPTRKIDISGIERRT